LGPLLFSIYNNEGKTGYELNENVNNVLLKVESWLKSNKLSLNFTKTKNLNIKPFQKKTSELSNFNVSQCKRI